MGLVFYLQDWSPGRAIPADQGEVGRTPPPDFARLIFITGVKGGPIPACNINRRLFKIYGYSSITEFIYFCKGVSRNRKLNTAVKVFARDCFHAVFSCFFLEGFLSLFQSIIYGGGGL